MHVSFHKNTGNENKLKGCYGMYFLTNTFKTQLNRLKGGKGGQLLEKVCCLIILKNCVAVVVAKESNVPKENSLSCDQTVVFIDRLSYKLSHLRVSGP